MSHPNRDRKNVFAHRAFAARADELRALDLNARFAHIYETNLWGSEGSRSGSGSESDQTARIRQHLPQVLRSIGATSMLDAPCGDFAWMRLVDLEGVRYFGADIVPEIVERNRAEFSSDCRDFLCLDLTKDPLPAVDLVFCRDCLVHLRAANIWKVVANLKRSGCQWLLTTTFTEHDIYEEIEDGDWRMLNLQREPFCFPDPQHILNEGCTESGGYYSDKSLGLWRIQDLPNPPE